MTGPTADGVADAKEWIRAAVVAGRKIATVALFLFTGCLSLNGFEPIDANQTGQRSGKSLENPATRSGGGERSRDLIELVAFHGVPSPGSLRSSLTASWDEQNASG